jgi:predicted esterase
VRLLFGGPTRTATRAGIRLSLALSFIAAAVGFLGSSSRAGARATLDVVAPSHGANVYVAPPDPDVDPDATHRFAFLHGMCSDAHASCEAMRGLIEPRGALACPTGNGACGGWADWKGQGEDKATHVDAALDAAWKHLGPTARGDEVLIGFSRGAFVARDIAFARPGRYRALVLIGAAAIPEASILKNSGIRRVVLASGDFDPARRTMEKAARELSAAGLPARYVHLGPVGHALPRDLSRPLGPAIDWALEE